MNHVERAVEACAVETLLICDSLFRSNDLAERRRYVQIVDSVKENMGSVRIFSSMHISGEGKSSSFSQVNVATVIVGRKLCSMPFCNDPSPSLHSNKWFSEFHSVLIIRRVL